MFSGDCFIFPTFAHPCTHLGRELFAIIGMIFALKGAFVKVYSAIERAGLISEISMNRRLVVFSIVLKILKSCKS